MTPRTRTKPAIARFLGASLLSASLLAPWSTTRADIVPAPDFPTGGLLIGKLAAKAAEIA